MKKYNLNCLKIFGLSILFLPSLSSAATDSKSSLSLGSHFTEGGYEFYPNYKDGIVMKDLKTNAYYLDGFPANIVDGRLEVKMKNLWNYRARLLDNYVRDFGISIDGHPDSSRVIIVDYTCPYSTSYVKRLKAELPPYEFGKIQFIPISRNMESKVILKSLGLQCIPKSHAANVLVSSFTGLGESIENLDITSCENEKDLHGLLNMMEVFQVRAVPALIEKGEVKKNPWSIFKK